MTRKEVLTDIDRLFHERLFIAIRKLYIAEKKRKLENTTEYKNSSSTRRSEILKEKYTHWNKEIENFYLNYKTIYALQPLVKRENMILEFDSQVITLVRVDYQPYDKMLFTATHMTRFTSDMRKEVEDTLEELKDIKYEHVVANYKDEKDTEKAPEEPLTILSLKYDAFYIFNFEYQYTTLLATLLCNAGLITNINTLGWNIEDDIVDEIITLLNENYDDSKVLQRKRQYENKSAKREEECIRPINFSNNYNPQRVSETNEFKSIEFENGREREDALKLYEFIYDITLSTQMKNSIYDTSTVDIIVGQHKLRQKAHRLIEGQANWELISGKHIKKLHENDDTEQGQSKIVLLPEFRVDDKLTPKAVYEYPYNARRPRRFGLGRFATQVLEKNNIGSIDEHDDIIANLVESKAVVQIKNMLHPQEIALFFVEFITEYMPLLVDLEYLEELEEKVDAVVDNDISKESLLDEVDRLIEEGFVKADYKEEDSPPSNAKIKLIQSIAKKHNLNLPNDIFLSNAKCDILLGKYPVAEAIKVGSCPNCNSLIFQKEYISENGEVLYYFSCEKFTKDNIGCSFSIWDNKIQNFFSERGFDLFTIDERRDALKKILTRKRGYLFSGFVDETHKPYSAKIGINSFKPKDQKGSKKTFWFLKEMSKSKSTVEDAEQTDIKTSKKEIRKVELKTRENIYNDSKETQELKQKVKQLEEKNDKIISQVGKDTLTGTFNKISLENDLGTFWEKNLSSRVILSLINIDKFRELNDKYGFEIGDQILKEVVQFFKDVVINLKTRVYKLDADNFCILFRENADIVRASMQSIKIQLQNRVFNINQEDIKISVTTSIGYPQNAITWQELLNNTENLLKQERTKR